MTLHQLPPPQSNNTTLDIKRRTSEDEDSPPLLLAIDIDEVLAQFLPVCNDWHNRTYNTNFTVSQYASYYFCETWGCSDEEAKRRVHDFLDTEMMKDLPVVPGAVEAIERLSKNFRLAIVTSRQEFLRESTVRWLSVHFGLHRFEHVLFGNQWQLEESKSASFTKSELCVSVKARALVDDLPRYALETAAVLQLSVLFNRDGVQGWSKYPPDLLPENVQMLTSWSEICDLLEHTFLSPEASLLPNVDSLGGVTTVST